MKAAEALHQLAANRELGKLVMDAALPSLVDLLQVGSQSGGCTAGGMIYAACILVHTSGLGPGQSTCKMHHPDFILRL